MTNIQENIPENIPENTIKKMEIQRKINGPPPPYLKENEKKEYFKRGFYSGSGEGLIEYDRTDDSFYDNNQFIKNAYSYSFHISAVKEINEHLMKNGYIDNDNPVTLADLYHKYTYGNFLPGGEFNNYQPSQEDIEFQKNLYNNT